MAVLTLPQSSTTPLSVRAKALVFEDPASQALQRKLEKIAPSDATVLVVGETGTGKEIVARHVHSLSGRRDRQFAAVNCGAFSESLVESELFGHERGAFTGALASKPGWFEVATGGTLFLDEIGDLPLTIQVKLLRVLQEGEVVRLGSRRPIPVDVRLIAATNVDLEQAVSAGRFREDLYYRLNVAKLPLSSLRERPGDILPLARHFLGVYRERLRVAVAAFAPEAERRLLEHTWPGNIRELENVVHHALLLCHGDSVTAGDLRLTSLPPRASRTEPTSAPAQALEVALTALFEAGGENLHERIERTLFRSAYLFCERNQVQTAKLLGISRNIVRARLVDSGDLAGVRSRTPTSSRRIRVGYQYFGLVTLLKARSTLDARFAEMGASVEWSWFPGGLEVVEGLSGSRVDFGVVGEGPPIFAHAARLPINYLAAEAGAPEGEAVIVHADSAIRSARDLRGKTVALNKGANVHYLLIRALEEVGLEQEDVSIVYLAPDAAERAFVRREVDAWAIWDPTLAWIQHATGARVLRDASGLATNATYYIAGSAFCDAEPALVNAFLTELDRTAAWARQNPEAAAAVMAKELHRPEGAMALALARHPGMRPLDGELVHSQQHVANTFFRTNLIPNAVSVDEATWLTRPTSSRVHAA